MILTRQTRPLRFFTVQDVNFTDVRQNQFGHFSRGAVFAVHGKLPQDGDGVGVGGHGVAADKVGQIFSLGQTFGKRRGSALFR